MSDPVVVAVEQNVGIIELARPEKYNCLSRMAWQMIDQARSGFEADAGVRAILIRAQGDNFCTGADLDEVKGQLDDAAATEAFLRAGHSALINLEASPLPVVAAVQGLCLAGGLELMLGADVAFAGESARLGDQHAQYGLIPGWGGSQRLPCLIGLCRALDLMYSARWLTAQEAHRIGLVSCVSADDKLQEEAMAYAVDLTGRSRQGLAEMKRLARRGLELPIEEAMRFEAETATVHLGGGDTAEGLAAFEARRKPKFD